MDWERRCIRLCGAMVASAILLRLWSGGVFAPVGRAMAHPQTVSFLLYLHTGRVVRPLPTPDPPVPALPEQIEETEPAFTAEDLALVTIDDEPGCNPDAASLLAAPMELKLTGGEPKVLILHTHTTESYEQTSERYEETSPYRTLDPGHNMLALGKIVAEHLESSGIGVIHDTTFHDYPSYNGSYSHAASAIRDYLGRYPTIELILDLHRDAADTPSGQLATRCQIDGERAAQLMFVLGTDTRLKHPGWEQNLSLALKLQVLLEKTHPGICRDLSLSKNRYNQHLGPRTLLVEIGAAGNTLEEAKPAAMALAEAIAQLCG